MDWMREYEEQIDQQMNIIEECRSQLGYWHGDALHTCLGLRNQTAIPLYLTLENEFYLGRGLYSDQIERWSKFYDPERFLFMSTEELEERPSSEIRRLASFLQLDDSMMNEITLASHEHTRKYPDMVTQECADRLVTLENRMVTFFDYFNQRLFDQLDSMGQSQVALILRQHFGQEPAAYSNIE
jgi:hypothetical protein